MNSPPEPISALGVAAALALAGLFGAAQADAAVAAVQARSLDVAQDVVRAIEPDPVQESRR